MSAWSTRVNTGQSSKMLPDIGRYNPPNTTYPPELWISCGGVHINVPFETARYMIERMEELMREP